MVTFHLLFGVGAKEGAGEEARGKGGGVGRVGKLGLKMGPRFLHSPYNHAFVDWAGGLNRVSPQSFSYCDKTVYRRFFSVFIA